MIDYANTNEMLTQKNSGILFNLSEFHNVYNLIPKGKFKHTLKSLKLSQLELIAEYERVLLVCSEFNEIEEEVKSYLIYLLEKMTENKDVINILKY